MSRFLILGIVLLCASVCEANEHLHHGHSAATVEVAPSWSAWDRDERLLTSQRFVGKPHVLILHQGSGCLHCAEQLHLFGKQVDRFADIGFEMVAISSDSASDIRESLKGFEDGVAIKNLGADDSLLVFERFDAVDEKTRSALHATFLIDGFGKIRWSSIGEHPYLDCERLLSEARLISTGATTKQEDETPDRPRVFLDKSPRIVAYQLKRLDNERLLMVERKTDDKKYVPVFAAILARGGMSPKYREEALTALTKLNDSTGTQELLKAIKGIKGDKQQGRQTIRDLTKLLVQRPAEELDAEIDLLIEAVESDSAQVRSIGFVGLMMAGQKELAINRASADNEGERLAFINAISQVPDATIRAEFIDPMRLLMTQEASVDVQRTWIRAHGEIPELRKDCFGLIATWALLKPTQDAAVKTLLKTPVESRDPEVCKLMATQFATLAEITPADQRTTPKFLRVMQLTDQLLARIPIAEAKQLRARLNAVTVRVVQITTVEDEMRYAERFFAVEAGRPVQVILKNDDLAAHNVVFCKPGKLQQVANDGLKAGIKNGKDGKQYVPDTADVLFASNMIQAHQEERVTFTAPDEPGEYPYVCTFPQHWPRMYGVMVVVSDLDEWLKNPVEPKDPIGSNRKFVKKWTVDEIAPQLAEGIKGRSLEIGQRIFKDATCLQCHQLKGEGGAVGPTLDGVFTKWKGDRKAILREILEPSHQIDEKYGMHMIMTLDGVTLSGIIKSQNDEMIELLDNPEAKEPTKVLKDDIDEMVRTSKSIMPKALMDNFTKDEIFELMHYIEASQSK